MDICKRCGAELDASHASWFNAEDICTLCAERERSDPAISEARNETFKAALAGNTKFTGIGLPRRLR